MQDVAQAAGVSRTTVSFVLNNTPNKNIPDITRQRVLDAAHELNYLLDSNQKNRTIALMVRRPWGHIAQAIYPMEVMRGLAAAVEPYDYQVRLKEVASAENFSFTRWVKQNGFAAVALDNVLMTDVPQIEELVQETTVVGICQSTIPGLHFVDVDITYSTSIAVDYLIELGHRRIAFISFASLDHLVPHFHLKGYQQALTHHGIEFDKRLVRYADFTSESGTRVMLDLLETSESLPSAVYVGGDVVTAGVLHAIRECGLSAPEDISVVSFGDFPFAPYLTPSLTTIHRPAYQIGVMAGEMLIENLNSNKPIQHSVLLETDLKIRDSVAPHDDEVQKTNGGLTPKI